MGTLLCLTLSTEFPTMPEFECLQSTHWTHLILQLRGKKPIVSLEDRKNYLPWHYLLKITIPSTEMLNNRVVFYYIIWTLAHKSSNSWNCGPSLSNVTAWILLRHVRKVTQEQQKEVCKQSTSAVELFQCCSAWSCATLLNEGLRNSSAAEHFYKKLISSHCSNSNCGPMALQRPRLCTSIQHLNPNHQKQNSAKEHWSS